MRDKTVAKTFRVKKNLDHFLEAALRGIYLPLYTMVTFTGIPYAIAAKRALWSGQDYVQRVPVSLSRGRSRAPAVCFREVELQWRLPKFCFDVPKPAS
jgi:hypothetical protein